MRTKLTLQKRVDHKGSAGILSNPKEIRRACQTRIGRNRRTIHRWTGALRRWARRGPLLGVAWGKGGPAARPEESGRHDGQTRATPPHPVGRHMLSPARFLQSE